ncbi:uncharacterized protein G2W53_040887 [Senna tora]|uniref:Uncharacterized protein n=1 Tax=Senna tora TaxID=362788 RepID=A0A834SEU9_9FABA|nr:uncharacterized protein G2W53_040887 [Senna tora]
MEGIRSSAVPHAGNVHAAITTALASYQISQGRKEVIKRKSGNGNEGMKSCVLGFFKLSVGQIFNPEDLGEFSDKDEYEASVPIRMSHQEKEDDNVWEDVVEEELPNFYSQVDVERARGFTGDFGPRSEDVGELYEGMKFPTKAALRRHVKLYH